LKNLEFSEAKELLIDALGIFLRFKVSRFSKFLLNR